ncbi:MAG: adenylate kinase [Anaerolineaceae bacterium]|nr:adenylate kinase [Anaerolineaceae bacterium]
MAGSPHFLKRIPSPRIAVVGITGSGKTTLAGRLARALNIPHVELDSLHWQKNWIMSDLAIFRSQVDQALSAPAWVVDGNYAKVRDLIWPRANTLVWIDYSLPVILWQLTRRTFERVFSHVELWNGNRETLRGAFFNRDSLFLWALQTHKRYRTEYSRLLSQPEYAHLQVIHLRSRKETDLWLSQVETSTA